MSENVPGQSEQIVRGARSLSRGRAQELELPPRSLTVLTQPLTP